MKKKLCWIAPSRERVLDLKKLIDSFVDNRDFADLFIVIDADDVESMNFYDQNKDALIDSGVFFIINKIDFKGAFLHIVNHYVRDLTGKYEFIGFLEDDCVILTEHFDTIIIQNDHNVIYLNDKATQPPEYAGCPIIKSTVLESLGFYSPPELKCLWADKYWKDLGLITNSIKFVENVLVSHEHYSFSSNNKTKDNVGARIEQWGHEDYVSWNRNKEKFYDHIRKVIVENK